MRVGIVLTLLMLAVPMSASSGTSPLEVVISTSNGEIGSSGDLQLEVSLKNQSKSPVTIFGRLLFGASGGLIVRIMDQDGNPVSPSFLFDEQVYPAILRDTDSYVTLQPNHHLGTTLIHPIKDLVRKPGIYRIVVDYWSPALEKYFSGPNPISREQGRLTSNEVTIRVK